MRLNRIADEVVTIVAIAALAYLGVNGIADWTLVAAIAGLGGYRLKKRHERR